MKIEADLKMQLTIHGVDFDHFACSIVQDHIKAMFCGCHVDWVLSNVDALSHLLVTVVLLCYVSFCCHCCLYSFSKILQK